jgi:hypothetical protein
MKHESTENASKASRHICTKVCPADGRVTTWPVGPMRTSPQQLAEPLYPCLDWLDAKIEDVGWELVAYLCKVAS